MGQPRHSTSVNKANSRGRGIALPRAVIFDLDGTLRDTMVARVVCMQELSRKIEGLPVGMEDIKAMMRTTRPPWEFILQEGRPDREQIIAQWGKLLFEIWPVVYPRELRPIPGARETLEKLTARGIKVGIVSSSWASQPNAPAWEKELYSFVTAIVDREVTDAIKPSPQPVVECLRQLGVSPREAVMVGDAPADIQAGKAVGLRTIAVLTGVSEQRDLEPENPDLILESVARLPEALGI